MFWGISAMDSGGNSGWNLFISSYCLLWKKKLGYLIYFQFTENHVACQPLPEIFTDDDNHQLKNNT